MGRGRGNRVARERLRRGRLASTVFCLLLAACASGPANQIAEGQEGAPGVRRILLAPLTAMAIAELVLDGRHSPDLAAVRPERLGL